MREEVSGGDEVILLQPAGWCLKPERPPSCGVTLWLFPGFGIEGEVIIPDKIRLRRRISAGLGTNKLGSLRMTSPSLSDYLFALPDPRAGCAPLAFPFPACWVKGSGGRKSILLT